MPRIEMEQPMSGTSKPDAPSDEPLDVPGPLPELPSLEPVDDPNDDKPDDKEPRTPGAPFIQPGTQ
jgi:hypothetical protein